MQSRPERDGIPLARRSRAFAYLVPTGIALGSFLIRLFVGAYGSIDLDEGNFLYDALLLSEGKIPYRDYFTRSVGLHTLLAFPIYLGGVSLFWGRLVVALAGGITTYLVFLLGFRLFSFRAGVLASILFGLAPLAVYSTYIIKTEPVQALFIAAAFLALYHALHSGKKSYYLMTGILLGFAFLVRRSSFLYLPLLPVVLLLPRWGNVRSMLGNWAISLLGFMIVVAPFLGFLVFVTDPTWVSYNFGSGTVSSYLLAPLVPLNRLDVLYNVSYLSLYLFVPAGFFVGVSISNGIRKLTSFEVPPRLITLLVASFFVALIPFRNAIQSPGYGRLAIPEQLTWILIASAVILVIVCGELLFSRGNSASFTSKSHAILAWWFLPPLLLYGFFLPVWFVGYAVEFLVPLSLAAAVVLEVIIFHKLPAQFRAHGGPRRSLGVSGKIVASLLLGTLVIVTVVPVHMYQTLENPDRAIGIDDLRSVSSYLRLHGSPDDEVFTALPLFAFESGTGLVMNVTRPLVYLEEGALRGEDPLPYDPFNVVPSVPELIEYLRTTATTFAVLDERTKSILSLHEDLSDLVYSNYLTVAEFGTIEVTRHKKDFTNLPPNSSFEVFQFPGVPQNWTFSTAGDGSPAISSVSIHGNYSYSVTIVDDPANISDLWTAPIQVTPGDSFLFSVWYRTVGEVEVKPFLRWLNYTFSDAGRIPAPTLQHEEWAITWVRGVVPPGVSNVQIFLRVVGLPGGQGTVWFDNLVLTVTDRLGNG